MKVRQMMDLEIEVIIGCIEPRFMGFQRKLLHRSLRAE